MPKNIPQKKNKKDKKEINKKDRQDINKNKKIKPEDKRGVEKIKLIIFDMDGVLVDVSQSYLIAIKKTAEFFIGEMIDCDQIIRLKMMGGYNDDYDCAEAILKNHGKHIRKEIIIKKFQEYYMGKKFLGLIQNERWLADNKILSALSKKYKLAIFTGRPRYEAMFALKASNAENLFKMIVCMEDTPNKKPAPDGINLITKNMKTNYAVYVGDSVDDLMSARAAEIGFVGVVPPEIDKARHKSLLKESGAKMIIDNVNQLPKVLK